jgi:hypothetical protein
MAEPIELEELPNYGDLITMKNFIRYCVNGWFIDYDGHGRYVVDVDGKKMMTNLYVHPSEVLDNSYKQKYKFVMWFNR